MRIHGQEQGRHRSGGARCVYVVVGGGVGARVGMSGPARVKPHYGCKPQSRSATLSSAYTKDMTESVHGCVVADKNQARCGDGGWAPA